jgi:hypothetical protein
MSGGKLPRLLALGGALAGPAGTDRNESRPLSSAPASVSDDLGSTKPFSFTLWYTPRRLPGCDLRTLAGGGVGLVGVDSVAPSSAFLAGDSNAM